MPSPTLDAFLERLREQVVEEVARTTPDLAAQGGLPAARREVAELVEHLALAVELDAPRLFVAHVGWTHALAGKRGRGSLLARCLEVTQDRLRRANAAGGPAAEVRKECLRLALEAVDAARALPEPRPAAALEVTAYLAEASAGRRRDALARVERWSRALGPVPTLLRLADAQREAGERWFTGEYPVAIEHRITAVTETALYRLAPPPGGKGRAVFACAPGDFHSTGPAIAAALLGHHGWDVEHLGAATPPEALAEVVEDAQPQLVGLGVGPLLALGGAREAARAARAAWPAATLVAGGWAARVAGAELLGVDRLAPSTYGGEPPLVPARVDPP